MYKSVGIKLFNDLGPKWAITGENNPYFVRPKKTDHHFMVIKKLRRPIGTIIDPLIIPTNWTVKGNV